MPETSNLNVLNPLSTEKKIKCAPRVGNRAPFAFCIVFGHLRFPAVTDDLVICAPVQSRLVRQPQRA